MKKEISKIAEEVNELLETNGVTAENGYSYIFTIAEEKENGYKNTIASSGDSKGIALCFYSFLEKVVKREFQIGMWLARFLSGDEMSVANEEECTCDNCMKKRAEAELKNKESESGMSLKDFLSEILRNKN